MKLNKKIISIVALGSVIAFTGVQAHERDGEGKRLERMTKHLGLSDEQQSNITTIITQFKAQHTRPNREDMKAKGEAMKEKFAALMAQPTFDEAEIVAQLEERSAKHNNRKVEQLRLQHAIYQQLTPEQQPKYLKMMEKKMRKMKRGDRKHRQH